MAQMAFSPALRCRKETSSLFAEGSRNTMPLLAQFLPMKNLGNLSSLSSPIFYYQSVQ
jgi:hypothetical protein